MSKFKVGLVTVASLLVLGAGCRKNNGLAETAQNQPRSKDDAMIYSTSSAAGAPLLGTWQTYSNQTLGIKFNFPADIFVVSHDGDRVLLTSKYFVDENNKGTPDGATRHPFQVSFELRKKGMGPSMHADSPAFAEAYEQNTMNGEKLRPREFIESVVAGKVKGYSFLQGVEGTNTRVGYLPKNFNETLVIKFSYITDFLHGATKPTWFPEKEQLKVFSEIMKSLEFIN